MSQRELLSCSYKTVEINMNRARCSQQKKEVFQWIMLDIDVNVFWFCSEITKTSKIISSFISIELDLESLSSILKFVSTRRS